MTIGEANDVALLLRFAAGQPTGAAPERLRDAFVGLALRAEKPLQMRLDFDEHGLDRAIAERLERGAL